MLRMFAVVIVLLVCSAAVGQETQSVLMNPPEVQAQVQPAPPVVPQVTYVLQRGWFGKYRLTPVYPVQLVLVRPAPRPVVIWQPWVVWR